MQVYTTAGMPPKIGHDHIQILAISSPCYPTTVRLRDENI